MTRDDRWVLMRRYGFGLTMLVLMYLLVTILRSIRADFATEIWIGLGEPAAPRTFTTSEILVALGVVVMNGSLVWVRDNRRAFNLSLLTCLAGFGLLASALLSHSVELRGFGFMVLVGLGLYLPYVAIHATVFERLQSMTLEKGNVGFLRMSLPPCEKPWTPRLSASECGPEKDRPRPNTGHPHASG